MMFRFRFSSFRFASLLFPCAALCHPLKSSLPTVSLQVLISVAGHHFFDLLPSLFLICLIEVYLDLFELSFASCLLCFCPH